jgi:hypothetical protein
MQGSFIDFIKFRFLLRGRLAFLYYKKVMFSDFKSKKFGMTGMSLENSKPIERLILFLEKSSIGLRQLG